MVSIVTRSGLARAQRDSIGHMTFSGMTSAAPSQRPRRPLKRLTALVTAVALLAAGGPASAQPPAKGPPVIRDAEIEQLLREYTQPLLAAAGLAKQNIQVVIINDRAFNAF